MLNRTTRKQVEKILPEFRRRWPTPAAFLAAPGADVVELCRPLGFASRRTVALKKMTAAYLTGGWSHAQELPGIGPYAAASWEIFCAGVMPSRCPKDHALTQYWEWATRNEARLRDEEEATRSKQT